MNCEHVGDRLYDDDCRHALDTNNPAPPDLREHLAACIDCRAAWVEAADDLRLVRGDLIEGPPAALERRLRIAFAGRTTEPVEASFRSRVERLAQSAALGAMAALGTAPMLLPALGAIGPALLGLTGACVGFAGRAVIEALELRSG